MTRKKKPLPILEHIEITDFAAEGKSLARVDDMVVFVPWAVPGDVVDLQVRRKKHSYMEAEVIRYHKYSKVRAEAFCQHFGVCGGCKWQQLPYDAQLKMKQQQVYDQLHRIGKVELPEFRPILGSVKTREYRNKLDFGCANKRYLTKEEIESLPPAPSDWKGSPETAEVSPSRERMEGAKDRPAIGFHITGAFDKILPIEKCWLMDDLHNEIRNEVYRYAIEHNLSFFDLRQQVGLLRDVIIRNSASGEWMVIFQFHLDIPETLDNQEDRWQSADGQQALGLLQHIADKFPQITSLMYLDNQKCNDTIGDQEILVFKGEDHIYELMEDLKFKVGPKSFYQTNTEQAYHLYSVAREFAFESLPPAPSDWKGSSEAAEASPSRGSLEGTPLVYDLYTGTGTIANFVAKKAKKVIGIEYVPEAIEDAKINSKINGIENTLFFAGDMKDILTDEFIAEYGRPDVIITDPPRAGMHPDVIKTILRAQPQRIVYVSCNPATQARDLQLLDEQYRVAEVQPVDMFPHTPHVENVVLLTKK